MIEIIKHSNDYKCVCGNCGTHFSFTFDDVKMNDYGRTMIKSVKCPVCKLKNKIAKYNC